MVDGDAIVIIVGLLIAIPLGIAAVIFLIVPAGKAAAWLIRRVFTFIGREIADLLRIIGSVVTSLILVPITLLNVLLGRWSSAAHYGRAIETEWKAIFGSIYRVLIGHPARLLCLTPLTEGLERRIPEAVAHAPAADKPGRRVGQFDGYTIVGSLPGGGSGSRLYVAEPTAQKLAAFNRMGIPIVDRVVIKSFSLNDGSSLPQIVRENRALPAAKRLGLILEHELTDERFYYVMRYVPGDSLGVVTQRLHALAGGGGLSGRSLAEAVSYAADIVDTLTRYHSGGLWHKDVKPDNIIVSDGRAHLVDFGLITPLRSSMTLTTHGTEYFRDPEMVRMALRGVKVHEVDGAKFDIYAAGAVLYSMIENSFPAHGGLSQISRKCPEAIRWVVRRAMTDYDKRYESAAVLLADLQAIAAASDPFALRPADLPSVRHGSGFDAAAYQPPPIPGPDVDEVAAGRVGPAAPGGRAGRFFENVGRAVDDTVAGFGRTGSPIPGGASATTPRPAGRPAFRVTSWWSGRYSVDPHAHPAQHPFDGDNIARNLRVAGATAAEQLGRARDRARQARERAQSRMTSRRKDYPGGVNAGVGFAAFLLMALGAVLLFGIVSPGKLLSRHINISNGAVSIDTSDMLVETPEPPEPPLEVIVAEADAAPRPPEAPAPPVSAAESAPAATAIRTARNVPTRVNASVLVVQESLAFSLDDQKVIEAQLSRLRQTGFRLVGAGQEEPAAAGQPSPEMELLAGFKSAVGLAPFAGPQAAQAARDWLAEHDDLAMVVWVGRGDDTKPQVWVIGRRGCDPALVSAAGDALGATGPLNSPAPAERRRPRRG